MQRWTLKLLARLWLVLCIGIAAVWVVEALDLRLKGHLWGPWSFQISDNWGGKISLIVFHDFPSPVIGPQLDPGNKWNVATMTWADKQPQDIYRHAWGFDRDEHSHNVISPNRNIMIIGKMIILRMPSWVAGVMWLPFAVPVARWWKRRRWIEAGVVLRVATIFALVRIAVRNAGQSRQARS